MSNFYIAVSGTVAKGQILTAIIYLKEVIVEEREHHWWTRAANQTPAWCSATAM